MSNLPLFWENLINSESGLPVVFHSVQRMMDGRYQVETDSVHNEFELVYVQKATRAHFEIMGEHVPVHRHDLLLIKPNTPHKLDVATDKVCQFLVLKFGFTKKDGTNVSGVSMDEFLNFISDTEAGGFFRLTSIYRTGIVNAMTQIMAETREGDEASEFMSGLLAMELFVWLSRSLRLQWESDIAGRTDKMRQVLETARNYIIENYNQDISLSDVANYVYISTSHFARAFKKAYDVSPIQFLLRVRIQKAQTMLEQTDKKVGEIALEVGFSAQQRFNDIFRKQIGVSPGEYRSRYKASIMNVDPMQ
ncbi:MAG: AraC family transcriptional regulator [Clostridia bacterium]|nr:AraC family transcriptional regulator [Clostridia bacterium]